MFLISQVNYMTILFIDVLSDCCPGFKKLYKSFIYLLKAVTDALCDACNQLVISYLKIKNNC